MKKISTEVKVLLLGTLFTRTALFMSTPFLAIYLSNKCHFSALQIGYILGVGPLINVLGSPLGGFLSDKFNSRTILTYIPILWGVTFSCFYFAESFYLFLLLNALNGLCYVIFEPTSKKALSFHSKPEQRIIVYNFRYAAINIGGFLGPLLSLLFHVKHSLRSYLLLGILYILYGIANRFVMPLSPANTKKVSSESIEESKLTKTTFVPYLLLLAGITFSYFAYAQFNSTVPQFLASSALFDDGVRLYSLILTMNAAMILLLQFPVLRVTKSFSSYSIITASNSFFCLSLWLLPQASHSITVFFIALTNSLGELLLGARFDFLIDSLAPSHNKGFYFGLAELTKLGNSLGPVVGALFIHYFSIDGYQQLFFMLGLITLGGIPFIRLSAYYAKKRHPS